VKLLEPEMRRRYCFIVVWLVRHSHDFGICFLPCWSWIYAVYWFFITVHDSWPCLAKNL